MTTYYFDASAAVKGYVAEQGSSRVLELLGGDAEHRLYLSRVGMVEVVAGIFGKVRVGESEMEEALSAVDRLKEDVDNIYRIVEVSPATADTAIEMAEKHRLRAYDCMQLATVLLLHRQRTVLGLEPLVLLSSDGDLNAAGRDEGLAVEDPARGEVGSQPARADDADEEQET